MHRAVLKNANFADLNVGVSSLYLLAAPSTSEAARAEVAERTADGEGLSDDLAAIAGTLSTKAPRLVALRQCFGSTSK